MLASCPDAGVLPARLAAARRAAAAPEPLTERELTVLRFLSSGLSEREIARELYLSFNTVHTHVKSLYRSSVSPRARRRSPARVSSPR